VPLPSLGRRVGAPFPNPAAKLGEPEPALRAAALLEQLGFNAIRPRQPPRGDCDAAREHGLQCADRRQLRDHRRLEIGELGRILVGQHDVLFGAHAVLQGILRRPGLAFGRLRPTRLRSIAPARFSTRTGHGDGRAGHVANTGHGGIP
jgi:hypothetical protein